MRRGTITLLVVVALLALVPGIALARNFVGTNGNDRIIGTQAEDLITARGGNDVVEGRGSDDEINGGSGDDRLRDNTAAVDADEILGGRGRDIIDVADGDDPNDPVEPIIDEVDCGPGIDTVMGADDVDIVDGETCERGENIDPVPPE
jgi:Ca2+-binding RTX toxin-like protein